MNPYIISKKHTRAHPPPWLVWKELKSRRPCSGVIHRASGAILGYVWNTSTGWRYFVYGRSGPGAAIYPRRKDAVWHLLFESRRPSP